MLINHKNFHFTQIRDKINAVILLKSPETMFWIIFDHFRSFLPRWNAELTLELNTSELNGQLSLSSFWGWLNEYQELLRK